MKRYFDDYEYEEVPKKSGRGTKRIMVYIGETYTSSLTPEMQRKQCIWFSAVSLIGCLLHFWGAFQNVPSNVNAMIGVPAGLALIPLCVMALGSLNGFTVKGPMNKDKYRGTALYRRYGALFGGLLLAYSIVALLIDIIRYREAIPVARELILEAEYTVVFVICLWVYLTEKKTKYEVGRSKKDQQKEIAKKSRL